LKDSFTLDPTFIGLPGILMYSSISSHTSGNYHLGWPLSHQQPLETRFPTDS